MALELTPEEEALILKNREKEKKRLAKQIINVDSLKELYDLTEKIHSDISFTEFEERYNKLVKLIKPYVKKDPAKLHKKIVSALRDQGYGEAIVTYNTTMKLCVKVSTDVHDYTFAPYHDIGSDRLMDRIHRRVWKNPDIGMVAIDFRGNPIIYTDLTYYRTDCTFRSKSPSLSPALGNMCADVVNHMIRYYRAPWGFDDITIFAPKFAENKDLFYFRDRYIIKGSIHNHVLYNKVLSLDETLKLISKSFKNSVKTAIKDCRTHLKDLLAIQKETKS